MTTQLAPDPLLTIPEVCERLRISRATLYRWRSEGKPTPKSIKPGGGLVLYLTSEVERFLQEQNGKGDL